LTHPLESTEKLAISAANRIPVVYMPYCMMGGTAPMSFAGALAQCNAEALGGLVIHQLVSEGAPFIYGAMPSIMDMQTTIGSYGAVEFHLLVAAASELVAHYGLPFYGTAGCTDAKTLDPQAVAETTMEIFSTLLSRANLIHDVGVSNHCNGVNPELVVLCDEIIEMLKHYTQGVPVDDDTLCLELIEKVGPTGAYLEEDHTFENFSRVFYSGIFTRAMNPPDESQVETKIREKIQNILEAPVTEPLPVGIRKQLDRWSERLAER
jgi:trimethylamine--corrinoid protein Co-methyltransferase